MTTQEIRELCRKLEDHYPDGGYVSRSCIFRRANSDGLITLDQVNEAADFYGSLWTYVGD